MSEENKRSKNPIKFEVFLPAYQKAIQNNLDRKGLADLLKIDHENMRHIETHLTFLKKYCKDNGLEFTPLKKDKRYEHLKAEANKKKALIEKMGLFTPKKNES
jgi:hypothetical protein